MPNAPIDPMTPSGYVLEGRVITMGPQGVLPRGAVYGRKGRVVRFTECRCLLGA